MGDKVSRLRQALNEMRVPNKEVAEKCQYAESTVSQYLAGKKKIPERFYKQACAELGISLDWLNTGRGEMRSLASGSSVRDMIWNDAGEKLKAKLSDADFMNYPPLNFKL